MSCAWLETRLEAFLAGALSPAEAEAAGRHLRECRRCAELVELARIAARPADPGAAAPPPELVADVLRATSGPTCLAAERDLCDLVDGVLVEGRAEPLQAHLSACPGCRALAGALSELASDLPSLAEIRPNARFTESVLAATLPRRVRLGRWWRQAWPRWAARPRFAAEAAYATTLIAVLVFSTPGSPLAAMPQRAAELALRTVPAAPIGAPWERLEATVAPKVAAVSSGATRAVREARGSAGRLGSRALSSARELGGGGWRWIVHNLRTFRQGLASLLETADEALSAADRDPDEENR